ncbi:MAG: ribosome maturation factor RimP [bacterium]|nr:ribosome maturation factor RimP [bacterium]
MNVRLVMQSILDKVKKIIVPHEEELNVELFDINCVKLKNSWLIKIFIDSEEGITVDKCQEVSKFIGNRLDDVIEEKYRLEVSSPGIERSLRNDKDYRKYKSYLAEIKITDSQGLKKTHVGYIDDLEEDILYLKIKETQEIIKIPFTEIIKGKLKFEFKNK